MIHIQKVNQYIALVLLISLGALLAFGLLPFLTSFLGAVTLYFLLKPFVNWIESKMKISNTLSVSIALIVTFIVVLLPILLIIYSLAGRLSQYLQEPEVIMQQIQHLEQILAKKMKIDLLTDANIETLKSNMAGYISNFLGQTLSMLATLGIMYFLLYFMLTNADILEKNVFKLLPYTESEAKKLESELEGHIFSNVIISPLLALVQGICASILFWACGLEEPFFWGIICGIFSFIPFVGSAVIWLPAGLFMLSQNETLNGIIIIGCGALIISNVDNVFRFVLQKRFANIHPIVTVLGVIIGLDWFGFTGIIFGPVLISFFLILLKNFRKDHITS